MAAHARAYGRSGRLLRRFLFLVVLAAACVLPLGAGESAADTATAPTPPMKIVDSTPAASVDLDPATSFFATTWMLEYATCLKLMNYPDVAGTAGARPQLEAAQSYSLSGDKRTYTFTIAPGLGFSPPSTDTVTADSFRVALERVATLAPDTATLYYSNIQGLQAFIDGTASSISGVHVSGNQLQITLLEPDPAFLHKVALPFMCAVPATTPLTASHDAPPPMAGPYYIDPSTLSDMDGKATFSLILNPNYTGSRPATLPQIDFEFGVNDGITRAQADPPTADLVVSVPGAQRASLAGSYGVGSPADAAGHQQYYSDALLATRFLVLNTRAGGNLTAAGVRRAVSKVLDRNALAALTFDSPTDQYLPPGIAGFRDESLYSYLPDIAGANTLLEGAGYNAGHHLALTLVVPNSGSGTAFANAVQAELQQTYIDVTVDNSHGSTGSTLQWLHDNPTGYDLAQLGWIADYPDPAAVLHPLLSGSQIGIPNNVNLSLWDDPATNDRFAYADSLTPDARSTEYGSMDIDLAGNQAPLVAYANIIGAVFTSQRLGCYVHQTAFSISLGRLCERQAVAPGGTYSTGANATPSQPLQASITSPNGGNVAVSAGGTATDVSGYDLLGQELTIQAPDASAAAPLTLAFSVDAAALAAAGVDASTVAVLRNGSAIPACTVLDGTATPDPCISSRTTDGNGDAHITVLSSHASTWSFAAPDSTAPSITGSSLTVPAAQPGQTTSVHVNADSDAVAAELYVDDDAGVGLNNALSGGAGSFDSPAIGGSLSAGTHVIGVRVRDAAHNWSSADETLHFIVDGTAPHNPTLSSPDHTLSTWSGDNTVQVAFAGATDNLSGVAGYSYQWSTSATTVPDTVADAAGTATGATSSPLPTGNSHWFHLRTRDAAGNWSGAVHLGPFWIDTSAPLNPALSSSSHTVGVPSQNPIVDVQWSGATDTGIGVDGYSFEWSQSASTLPDTTKDADAASTGTTSPTLANGSWYLHVRTVDKLGHWTATAATIGPFVIAQSTPPKKCVVPKVVGKTLKAAKAAIKKAHCSMGKVSYASAPKAKRGRVLKQSPKPGKRLAAGARVNLTVGRAKKH